MTKPSAWISAVVIAAAAAFLGLHSRSLWTPDEPRDAAIGLAMARTDDWIVPRLNGQPFLEKPPLYWWIEAAGYRVFGATEAVSRLPTALFCALTLLLVFAAARSIAGTRTAILALVVLSTSAQFAGDMHRAIVDPALVFFVALAQVALLASPSAEEARTRWTWAAVCGGAVGLAFLSKGWIGPLLSLAPPVAALTIRRDWIGLARLRIALGLAFVGLVVAGVPWTLALSHAAGWPAVRETLVSNLFDRIFSTDVGRRLGHEEPVWAYVRSAPISTLPWTIGLPGMLAARPWRGRPWVADSGLIVLSGLVLLSIPASKRSLYVVPLLPAFAVMVAAWLASDPPGADLFQRWTRIALVGLAALLPLGLWLFTAFGNRLSGAPDVWPLWRAVWSDGGLRAFGVIAAAWAVLVIAGARRAGWRAEWIAGAFLVLTLAAQTILAKAVDPLKDLHALTTAIAHEAPGADAVPAYQPSETLRGIVEFDLGRHVRAIDTAGDLQQLLAGPSSAPPMVVIRLQEWQELPDSVRSRLHLVYDERGHRATPYMIATP